MLQQDLLDTLFLNRKALADVGGTIPPTENANAKDPTPTTTTTTKPTMKDAAASGRAEGAVEKCPVDHKSREAWLAQARAAAQHAGQSQAAAAETPQPPPPQQPASKSSSSWGWPRIPFFTTKSTPETTTPTTPPTPGPDLGTDRVISTIPRSPTADPSTPTACPANHESETGADHATGNWVYPSEKMFFEAMRRKGHGSARAADMRTVVPIHNAVNERAWADIRAWERPYEDASSCPGGPRLESFVGAPGNMSPRARLNTLLGYTAPFDRHDWVVDRCGTKVEYVIDFYAGRSNGGGKPSFYLDVRPKLNSWEAVKMRATKALGLV